MYGFAVMETVIGKAKWQTATGSNLNKDAMHLK